MTKTKAFLTSDNQVFLTREDAQRHELEILVGATKTCPGDVIEFPAFIVAYADQIVAILATRKPRAPKAKPAKKLKATPTSEPKFSGPVHAT